MSQTRPSTSLNALAALLLPALAAPAWAAGSLQPVSSTALLDVRAYAGVAVVDANLPCDLLPERDEVETCSFGGQLALTLADAPTGTIGIAGAGTAHAAESLWSATMTLAWDTWQRHDWATSGADLVLSGGGGHTSTLGSTVGGPSVPPGFEGTRSVFVQNLQTLVFTLDTSTAITYSGSAFGEYMPVLLARLDGGGDFVDEGNIPESYSGTLAAGTYRLRNFFLTQDDFQTDWSYGWNYTLTFHDTVLTVPEAPPLAMLAGGLAAIAWCRRRRAEDRP